MQGVNFLIDHTNLKSNASEYEIEVLATEAKRLHFNSICVHPQWVKKFSQEYRCSAVIAFPQEVKEVSNIPCEIEGSANSLIEGSFEDHIEAGIGV